MGRASVKSVGMWLLLFFFLSGASLWAQTLIPDIKNRDPIGGRTPLILIHGICASNNTWKHGNGFRKFFYDSTLATKFKLYYFTYSTGGKALNEFLKVLSEAC